MFPNNLRCNTIIHFCENDKNIMTYTLYKNPIQFDTLSIVQYLYANNIVCLPDICIERNHPAWVTQPILKTTTQMKFTLVYLRV